MGLVHYFRKTFTSFSLITSSTFHKWINISRLIGFFLIGSVDIGIDSGIHTNGQMDTIHGSMETNKQTNRQRLRRNGKKKMPLTSVRLAIFVVVVVVVVVTGKKTNSINTTNEQN